MDPLRRRWTRCRERWPRLSVLVPTTIAVSLPLIVAVVSLASHTWVPVLDLAMTEFRVRDVGSRQTPLIGLPGRIGEFPDQGSHPGPLSFWLLAPGYRLFGSSAWAMEASTALIQTVWISVALWISHRRLGYVGVAMTALIIAMMIRGFGLVVLIQPWNPYLPLIAWLVVLLATWSVVAGDHAMLLPLVVAASFAAQTHIPYMLMAGGLGGAAAVLVAVRWWRSEPRTPIPRALIATTGLFTALWLPPLADHLRRNPGNVRRLIDHFGDPPEEAIGFGDGLVLLLRHLDVTRALGGMLVGAGRFIELGEETSATTVPGVVFLTVWVASFGVALRLHSGQPQTSLLSLHVVIAAVVLLSWISMSRIFGTTWFYLTLWAWVTMLMMVVAFVWTAAVWLGSGGRPSIRQPVLRSGAALAAVTTLSMIVLAPSTDHPEQRLGDTVGAVVDPTAAALSAGDGAAVGSDGRYVVFWTDAHSFGSQGYALVNELERRGFDVGVYEPWSVPVTSHRVIGIEDADAEVIWATGSFVEQWRRDDRVVEVATIEPRSIAELAEFSELRTRLIVDLTDNGLDDLVPVVDANLFGVRIDPRLSDDALAISRAMLLLDQNAAVFIGPPGVSQ